MKTAKTKNKRNWSRRGTTAVEFALTAPALLAVIFCTFEFARISMMRNMAHNAAYEAARLSICEGATTQEAVAEARRILGRIGARGATIDVNGGQPIDFDTSFVDVHVEIPMQDNAFVFPMFYTNKIIVADVSMRTERYNGFYNPDLN